MKKDIHPDYNVTEVTCTCGATFTTRSTAKNGIIHADVCSQCHPFYTGKQKILDTGGRVARFEARYAKKTAEPAKSQGSKQPPDDAGHRSAGPASFICPTTPPREAAMFEAVSTLVDEHAELERQLSQPETHADARLAKKLNQRYAELTGHRDHLAGVAATAGDIEAARELGADDPDFAAEAERMVTHREELAERLRRLLVPRDATDDKDAIVEVKSGEGGEESALFAGDLLRMYTRYADRQGWTTEVLDATESDLGGYKSVTVAVKAKGTPEPGHAPYALLKFEGGVHRVQRVPVTESQGRVHTSAAGVLVMPEAEPVDVQVDENDLRIDVFRSSGPGGQSVNTTDSAVRITHVPTGIVVSCQNEKSQLQNREQALRILRSRLLAAAQEEADTAAGEARRSQVRTVDRSERIRTYNYAENRISDHRTGYKAYNLDVVLDGDLQPVIESAVEADLEARLAAVAQE